MVSTNISTHVTMHLIWKHLDFFHNLYNQEVIQFRHKMIILTLTLKEPKTCNGCGKYQEHTVKGKYQGWGTPKSPGHRASIYQVRRQNNSVSRMSIPNTCARVKGSSGETPEKRKRHCIPEPVPSNMEVSWHPRLMAVLQRRHSASLLPWVSEA